MSASGMETRIVKLNDVNKDGAYIGQTGDTFVQLVAANGTFLYKDTPLFTATVQLKKVVDPSVGELKEVFYRKFPKAPLELLVKVEDFFARVYEKHKSEAVVLLYVSPESKRWTARVPEQTVSGASVEYDMKKMPQFFMEDNAKYYLFGSIHSHASMSAFHSGTDDRDEFHFDGLHVTIGDFNKSERSYAVRYIIHGAAFGPLNIRDVVEYPDFPKAECEDDWLKQVSERKYGPIQFGSGVRLSDDEWYNQHRSGKWPHASSPTGSLLSDQRLPTAESKAERKRKGKLRWNSRATFDHCYTCQSYSEGHKCSERVKTQPFASCNRYTLNPDVPERVLEEAYSWRELMEGKTPTSLPAQSIGPDVKSLPGPTETKEGGNGSGPV